MSDEFDDIEDDVEEEGLAPESLMVSTGRQSGADGRQCDPAWRRIEVLREKRELERLLGNDYYDITDSD